MKVRNIIFSGFAAAILMGTANAATTWSIASKAYVDSKVSTGLVDESTGKEISVAEALGTKADKSAVDTLAETVGDTTDGLVKDVDDLQTAVGDENGGLVKDVDDLQTAVGDENGGLVKDVDDLQETVGTDALTTTAQTVTGAINELDSALDGKVNVSDAATTIGAAASASDTKWATEKAVANALASVTGGAGSVSQQIEDALGDLGTGNDTVEDALADKADKTAVDTLSDNVGDVSTLSGFESGTDTVVEALNELNSGKQDTLTAAQQAAVDSGINATKVTTYDTLADLLNGYASCASSAESGHCVLSADTNGMSWVDVTDPYITVEP